MNSFRAFSCLAPLLLCLIGCGGSDEVAVYPVTGKVSFQGGSLSGYRISFVSPNGDGAFGVIKDDGTYALEVSDGRKGCIAGKFKVVIQPNVDLKSMQESMAKMAAAKPGAKGPPPAESKVPKTFGAAATSPKEVEVKTGPNTIDISI